jgi:spermidine/putrescine transport system substrate-binding protein
MGYRRASARPKGEHVMAGSQGAAAGLTRREVLVLGGLAAAGVASVPAARAAGGANEGQLNIYSWAQYQDPGNLKAFAKQAGVKLHTTFYTSNEQLLTQLQTTKGQKTYDIVVPDGDHVRIEKGDGGLGLLMPLDHSKIPNLKYLGSQWRKLSYDPGNKYSVPKDAGVTAFTYRTDRIKANLQSWKDFFAFLPHAKGLRVNFIESPAEVVGMALVALGYSMNTKSDKELNAAGKLLRSVKPYVSTINEVYLDDFSAGKIDLGITYSGDGLRTQAARKAKNDIRVVLPTGVSELWIDNWAISAYAPHPKAAHAWINYVLQPKVNAAEMRYVSYEVPTPASFASVGAAAKNPKIVFPPRVFKDYEILQTTPDGLQKRVKLWDQFKAS